MKTALLLFTILFSFSIYGQELTGVYVKDFDLNDGKTLIRTLDLKDDGTFTFHNFRKNFSIDKTKKSTYGKGTWRQDKKIITFFTDKETDIDEKYTLDFNETKARFHSKNPRDKSDRVILPSLTFFESNIPILENFKVFKK
ncbi:hypothetical protein [Patiriisocius hiemis]|uniref:Lipocalin-like domain-containing protein n=1 Tax=Patiriisocius hiemis TaxID=3075604 RepID=A0ABU2YAY8_9FLAO|nr:hypothetical protein [Constantimarinum sp. W242]MDT0555352.1 hypothetical protein [Constantimarinum sp. W242]